MIVTAKTRLYGIVGSPIHHSYSPRMHNLSFEKMGIDAVFLAFEGDASNIGTIFDAFRALGVWGGSITMPVKTAAVKYLDGLSREACLIGAANVFKNQNGKFIGYNTDGMGLVRMLDERGFSYAGNKVVVAGAGGAGRAIAVQLALSGAGALVLCDINMEGAQAMAEMMNRNIPSCCTVVCGSEEAEIKEQLKDASVYVDCTPLGMYPHEESSVLTSFEGLPTELAVVDITYAPSKTKLLQLAQAHGCRVCNGKDMVYYQGAGAFKIWTGLDMPLAYVKEHF